MLKKLHLSCPSSQAYKCVHLEYISTHILTHLPQYHLYVSVNWVSIGSGIGLPPVRSQAITWTNADFLSIGHSRTNFNEMLIEIQTFSLTKVHLKMLSAIFQPNCPGEDVLTQCVLLMPYGSIDLGQYWHFHWGFASFTWWYLTGNSHDLNQRNVLENFTFTITFRSPWGQWDNNYKHILP